MCGIAGAFSRGKIAPGVVEAATAAIAHRGPDDEGIQRITFSQGEAVFGNRRLAILDLSPAGHMPMHDPAGGNWITYNGEIYNFRELKLELERAGDHFLSDSDTEVILKGYARHGAAWFPRLRGMFALALFDAREEALVLARDRFGIKPLYYAERGDTLYFASEVRALLKTGAIAKTIDPAGLYQFLSFGSVYEPQTLVEGVMALPAGNILRRANGRMEIKPFASVRESFAARRDDSAATASAKVAELVRDSIRKHIVSDVPVSLFLSGGIDSSVLALALRQMEVPAIHSFSVVFEESDHSEADDARQIAAQAGTTHHEVMVKPDAVLAAIPQMLQAMDQPSFDGINSFVISQAVRSAGFKVALSGLGGDEVFAGYSTFTASPELEGWQDTVRRVPGFLRWPLPRLATMFSQSEDQKNKLRAVLSAPFPHPYGVLRTLFVPEIRKRLLKDFQDAMDTAAQAPLAQSVEESRDLERINRVSYLELTNYMRNTLLRDTDGMSMANSLEVRVPFVDQELIGYVAGLSGGMKRDGRRPKKLLTGAFEDVLPKSVVGKTKQGFTLPFRHWLLDDLSSTLEGTFATMDKGVLGTYLAPEAVRSVWSDFEAGKTSWTRPWSLFVLQRWCQYNLE